MKGKPFKHSEVKQFIESYGHILLSTEYYSKDDSLELICKCGSYRQTTFGNFKKRPDGGCIACQPKVTAELNRVLFADTVANYLEVQGCRLISFESSCKPCTFLCNCGRVGRVTIHNGNLDSKHTCEFCKTERRLLRGDRNSPLLKQWRISCIERDGYQCAKCTSKYPLHVHHILPWQHFSDLRFNVDNGVTLCQDCHVEYHSLFGKDTNCNNETINDFLRLGFSFRCSI